MTDALLPMLAPIRKKGTLISEPFCTYILLQRIK